MIYVGSAFQVAGFVLSWRRAVQTLRSAIPDYEPPHRCALNWWNRRARVWLVERMPWLAPWLGQRAQASGTGSMSMGGTATAEGERAFPRDPAATVDEQVAQLQEETDDLRSKLRRDRKSSEKRDQDLESKVAAVETDLRSLIDAQEQQRRDDLRRDLFWQQVGILLFVIGVVLVMLGSVLGGSPSSIPPAGHG